MEATGSQGARSRTRMRAALTRRFPDHAAVVERLIEECERFRELCVDYIECGEVLRRFEQHGDTNRHPAYANYVRERTDEYKELQAGLEEELLECLEDRAACPRCGMKHGRSTAYR